MHVVVIGAGIAGLGAAFELRKQGIEVTLLEADDEVGGRCRSFAWHGRYFHTGAEALMQSERSLTALRGELRERGAAPDASVDDWDSIHGERIYHHGRTIDLDPFSVRGLLRLPGGLAGKVRLAKLLPLALRQRRHHDSEDLTSVAWLDDCDGATYLRDTAPKLFDAVIEPFLQYTTLGPGDYGLAWLIFHSGDLSWTKGWWAYDERGSGGVTYELGRVLAADDGCTVRLGTRAVTLRRVGAGIVVRATSPTAELTIPADAVVIATPGHVVAPLLGELAGSGHRAFLDTVTYGAHHFARYLIGTRPAGLPRKVLLPTAEGFTRVAKITCTDVDAGLVVTADIKDPYARTVRPDAHDQAFDDVWSEVVRALPALADTVISDRTFTRNDVALCRRPAGFVRALDAFLQLPPIPRVALAGDYLLDSTVGLAHLTGVRAADQVVAELTARRVSSLHG